MSLSPPSSSAPPVFPTGGTIPGNAAQHQQLAISNGVLLAAVIFLFMVVVFVFLLYLYAKRYLGANPLIHPPGGAASSRFVFIDASPLASRGLPAAVLRALPVTVYYKPDGPTKGGEGMECAVCLSEVGDGEKVRALPKCGHGFHVECIDMWFHSHDTCPLCRGPVEGLPPVPREDHVHAGAVAVDEIPVTFPTNVLFWGTHDDVTNAGFAMPAPPPPPAAAAAQPAIAAASASSSSSASGRRKENNLVIDIPNRQVAVNSPVTSSASPATTPLPASRMPGSDDLRSPLSARLQSLCRLLSRGKQAVVGTSYSPRSAAAGDIEQGFAGGEATPRPPKTPKTPPPTLN